MAYNLDFDNTLYMGLTLNYLPSHTQFIILGKKGIQKLADNIYSTNSDFFLDLQRFFGSDLQNTIQSLRWYPFNIPSYFNTDEFDVYSGLQTFGGKRIADLLSHTYQSRYFVIGKNSNIFTLGDFDVPYFQDVDSFLSYEPYSHIKLYLPFLDHLYDIDCKRVRGKKLYVYGAINFRDGDIIYIMCTNNNEYIGSVSAHIAIDIPMYSLDYKNYMKQLVNASTITAGGVAQGNLVDVARGMYDLASIDINYNQVTQGSLDSIKGAYAPMTPTLLIFNPVTTYSLSDTKYNHLYGVPYKTIKTLNNVGGYTKVDDLHIKDMTNTTQEEVREIEEILKDGFINNGGTATLSISYSTSHISWSNTQHSITYGSSYSNTYTLDTNYQLDDIQVTMGGVDITATAVSGSHITISSVTGNIIIRTTTSKIPQTFTITYILTGATSSNIQATIIEGETFRTTLTPIYSQGYYRGGQLCTIAMTGSSIRTTPYSNIVINNVSGNITITLTCPQATTMNVENWIPNAYLSTPADVILNIGGLILYKNNDSAELTEATIDSGEDPMFNNSFIYGTGNIVGGATNVAIGVNGNKTITYDDTNPTEWGQMTKLHFTSTANWTTQPELLEWVDNNFTKET